MNQRLAFLALQFQFDLPEGLCAICNILTIQTCFKQKPGGTALQVTLQPRFVVFELSIAVVKMSLTILLLLVILGGRERPIFWPHVVMSPFSVVPQVLPIKIVPSPSVIVR